MRRLLALLGLLAATPAFGAAAFVNYITTGSTAATNSTFTSAAISITAGNLVLVGIGTNATSVTNVTDLAGNVYTRIVGPQAGNWGSSEIWASIATVTHATDTFTITVASSQITVYSIIQYSGIPSKTLVTSIFTKNTGSTTTLTSGSFTANAGDAVIVLDLAGTGGSMFTAGTNYVKRTTVTTYPNWEDRLSTVAGAQTASITWTPTGSQDQWVVVFSTVAAGGCTTQSFGGFWGCW